MCFPEDAACVNPCGEEPMGCTNCPERGNTGKPHDKAYYMDMYEFLEENGWVAESRMAYKDIDLVMEAQDDLVKIETRLTPLAVMKG